MICARVVGTVTASSRADRLDHPSYLLVEPCRPDGSAAGGGMVALDLLGAGPDELVLVSQGSSTRQTGETRDRPVDALIMGIIDAAVENGEVTYQK